MITTNSWKLQPRKMKDTRQDSLNPCYMLLYVKQPVYFKVNPPEPPVIEKFSTTVITTNDTIMDSMEGYAFSNIVFLLDVSSSMDKEEKLPLLKKSLKKLLTIMRNEDKIAIAVCSGEAKIVLEPASATDKKIVEVIDNLRKEDEPMRIRILKWRIKLQTKIIVQHEIAV